MKESIFYKKMQDPKFKDIYDDVSTRLNIGEELAKIRHQQNITQLELAEKVHTSRSAIARYESGNYIRYNIHTLLRIAKALGRNLKISFVTH